jgi:hypothetical protein
MDFVGFMKLLSEIFPVFLDWIKWMINLPDKEFEEISKAWPAPTRTKLAWIRAESKALKHFGVEDEHGS